MQATHLLRIGIVLCIAFFGISAVARQGSQPQARTRSESNCRESVAVRREAPRQENADPLGPGPWYVNDDATIWALKQPWRPGVSLKTAWIKPAGSTLRVTGRRLDAEASLMEAMIPTGYSGGFQPSRLTFMTAGCWEVRATAGGKSLVFITLIS